MANCYEIAGSIITFCGAAWLSIDSLRVRRQIRTEAGARELLDILKHTGTQDVVTDRSGEPLNSEKALQIWLSARTITWNWVGLVTLTVGFLLDLIGKFKSA